MTVVVLSERACVCQQESLEVEKGRESRTPERESILSVEPLTLRESALTNSTVAVHEEDLAQRLSVRYSRECSTAAESVTSAPSSFLIRLFVGDKGEALGVAFIVAVSFAVGFSTADLGIVLDLVGALGATSICYILPGMIYGVMCTPATTPDEPACFYPLAVVMVPYGVAVLVVSLVLIADPS